MEIKTLGELCNIVSGGTPLRSKPEYWNNGTIPWIKIGDMKGKYINSADECITQAGLDSSSAKMLPKGTILYTIFATLGEVGILEINASTNQAIAGLTIKDNSQILSEYLYYYLKSKKGYVKTIGRGVAQSNINRSILKSFQVPLPTSLKQKEIVDILDKITNIIKYRQQELHMLDNLIKARFVEMFGDPVYSAIDSKIELSDICEKITDGEHGSVARVANGHPFLNAKHILKTGFIDWKTITYIGDEDHQRIYKRCNPEKGDILLTTTGTIGNVAIMPECEEVSMDRGITLLKINRHKVTSEFVAEMLKHPSIQMAMGANVHASAIGHLFMNKVKKLPAILPSMKKQIEFTTFVQQIDKSKQHFSSSSLFSGF